MMRKMMGKMIPVRFTEKEAGDLADFLYLAGKFNKLASRIEEGIKEFHSKYPIRKDKNGNWPKTKKKEK